MDYTAAELKKLRTISQGHTCNLKIDTGTTRVWLSRVDGSVTVEKLRNGRWEVV